jgi:NNP family nitrate/nitrite transporter-like MFS transporter
MNTLAFAACFGSWMFYGVLITFLVDNNLYAWTPEQIGLLLGTPILTGSLLRLPLGMLTDKYGGRPVYTVLMLLSALAIYTVSLADGFTGFLLAGLGFGMTGASFAVGVAYTSVWFPKNQQGTALGIFGFGNTGAALTSIFAPQILLSLTQHGQTLENWRFLPQIYAAILVAVAIIFFRSTYPRKTEGTSEKTFSQRIAPLKELRVWRFGLYYFFLFGGFVSLCQWHIPYYMNVYALPLEAAGVMAAAFSLPAGLFRMAGGWLADKYGARKVISTVLGGCIILAGLLSIPQLDIESPGVGVMAVKPGIVTAVHPDRIIVDKKTYTFTAKHSEGIQVDNQNNMLIFPTKSFWQEPVVQIGQKVSKKQLLAKGVTYIHFQANVWIFTFLVILLGALMGIGGAGVFKYIPDYYPNDVGVVAGLVGKIGGLGGFFLPILFGYLLSGVGLWSSSWMFLFILGLLCMGWFYFAIKFQHETTAGRT